MLAMMVVLTVAAACSDGEAQVGVPSATVGTEAPTTTTTNPYAVPAVIDAAYVNRVLGGLDQIAGNITREVFRSRSISDQVVQQLRAIYSTDPNVQLEIDLFQELARSGFASLRDPPGNQVTKVEELITAESRCIFARVSRDLSAVSKETTGPSPRRYWVALVPLDPARDVNGLNGTSWAYRYDGFPPPGFPDPPNQCDR